MLLNVAVNQKTTAFFSSPMIVSIFLLLSFTVSAPMEKN